MPVLRSLLSALLSAAPMASVPLSPPSTPRIAVLDFELHDLTPTPNGVAVRLQVEQAGRLLRRSLGEDCGYELVAVDPAAQRRANASEGYLFARPDEAAHLARAAGANWVVLGRLSVASPIVSEFHVELVRVSDARLASAVSIEMKGNAGDSTVFARGIGHVARQLDRALVTADTGAARSRQCPAATD